MSAWYADAFYLRNVDTEPAYPQSEEKIEKEIQGTGDAFYFHVRTLDDDRLIGFATLHSLEWNNQLATLAIGIGNEKDNQRHDRIVMGVLRPDWLKENNSEPAT